MLTAFAYGTGLYLDPFFLILIIPTLLLSLGAQWYIRRTYARYLGVTSARGVTAEAAARTILDSNGCGQVRIEPVAGTLTDHYDPRQQVLRLSSTGDASRSVAAIGVAAHEAGHAIQHQEKYLPMRIRSLLVPVARIGSMFGPYLALIGIFMAVQPLVDAGILLFAGAVAFYLVTLPVELDASRRAIRELDHTGVLGSVELSGARKVLAAAALTYVASVLVAFAGLLRLLLLSRGMRRR